MFNLTDILGKHLHRRILKSFGALNLNVTTPDGYLHQLGNKETDAHIHIRRWSVFWDMLIGFDLGFAKAYIDGKWDSTDLTYLFESIAGSDESDSPSNIGRFAPIKIKAQLEQRVRVSNNRFWAKRNIKRHYDLERAFFQGFLDESMTYSSAVFEDSNQSLELGQQNKVDLLFAKCDLNETDHILDIGCGWGYLMTTASIKFGCKATGVTLSKNQFDYCQDLIHKLGLEGQVEVILGDYRQITGKFDHIFSVEMIEAVGHNGIDIFFDKCFTLLKSSGSIQMQAINIPHTRYDNYRRNCDFIQKYIFPGGLLPSLNRIHDSANRHGFGVTTYESIGLDYASTLEQWKINLRSNLQEMQDYGFDSKFLRMFDYYFSYCAGAFKTGHIDNHQISISREN